MRFNFVVRLGAFTISLLLLTQSIEPGWGIDGDWGWFLLLFLLALGTAFADLLRFVVCVLSFLLLVGLVEPGRAAYIALTIFTGASLLAPLSLWRYNWQSWTFGLPRRRDWDRPPRSWGRRWLAARQHWWQE